jgi:ABC-2 type transport system permease protein
MISPRRVAVLAGREAREILRDKLFFALVFVVPGLLMLVFGYGLSYDVENIPIGLVDNDRSPMSRDYAARFLDSRYFDFKGAAEDERPLIPLLSSNRLRAVIIIPSNFGHDLLSGRSASVQTLIDGTFPFRAQTTKGYIISINNAANSDLLAGAVARGQGIRDSEARALMRPVELQVRLLYNPGMKSSWTLAPRLMMVILIIVPPFCTALGVIREVESGAIYNIYSSTAGRLEYLLGKLSPYVLISTVNAVVLFLMVTRLFGAPFKGSMAIFAPATLLYIVCTTGIGLAVSVLVRTQMAAMVVTAIVTIVPAVLYSGVFVPIQSLTPSARFTAHLLPSLYYNNIVIGCFLKGLGVESLWREMLVLAGYASGLFALGLLVFHKRPSS